MIGIPYMGSKRKLAKPIIDYILANNPNTKYIYDLFGGGGAISFEALKRKKIQKVHYNDNDWFGGLVATCWSFANNKHKGYLFSEDNEKI